MSYIVFARKYRPQTFDEIIGQPHITTTLKNAISSQRTAHAYLFAGPRGVGKTTTARIFAKSLNCQKGSGPNPCNACASCKEITQGTSLDIIEVDGASNRGIDEIRSLRENVKFAPTKGRFKIYIIDEVHMLTGEAFNALLKTLEEPPPHVKFIFATTQAHKVPPTILSRCQRFDFRRISAKDILANLKGIAKREKLDAEDEALALMAKYADGALRDAQVMLDQASSFGAGSVASGDVAKMLGVVSDDILFELAKSIHRRDAPAAVAIIDAFINDGKDIFGVVAALIEHFRNLAVARLVKEPAGLIDTTLEKIELYKRDSGNFTIEEILYIIYTLSSTIDFMRKSGLARIPFEAAMIKLTQSGSFASLADIVERIGELEKKLSAVHGPSLDTARDSLRSQSTVHSKKNPEETIVEKKEKVPEKNESPVAAAPRSADLEEVLSAWGSIIKHVMAKKTFIAYYLQEGYPVKIDSKTITIGFPKESKFHKEALDALENRVLIEDAIKGVLHQDLKIDLTLVDSVGSKSDQPAGYQEKDTAPDEVQGRYESAEKEVDPIIRAAMDMFGGEVAKGARQAKGGAR